MDNGDEYSSDTDYAPRSPALSPRERSPEREEGEGNRELGEGDNREDIESLEREISLLRNQNRFLESTRGSVDLLLWEQLVSCQEDLRDRDRTINLQNEQIRNMEIMLQGRERVAERNLQNQVYFIVGTDNENRGAMTATAAAVATNLGLMFTPCTCDICQLSANTGGSDPVGVGSAGTGTAESTVTTGQAGGAAGTEVGNDPATVAGAGFGGALSTMTSGSESGGTSSTSNAEVGGAENQGLPLTTTTAPVEYEIEVHVTNGVATATGNRIVSSTEKKQDEEDK